MPADIRIITIGVDELEALIEAAVRRVVEKPKREAPQKSRPVSPEREAELRRKTRQALRVKGLAR